MMSSQIEEQVVLVDENNIELGLMPKMQAHIEGHLHRAISVLIYNSDGEMLIQQRSASKYHWPNIWSNACCTHPRKDEDFMACALRRVKEELGLDLILEEKFRFIYKATDEQTGLIEHEYDVVYTGIYDGDVPFNMDEVRDIKWIVMNDLKNDIYQNSTKYSFWFKEILKQL